MVGTTCDSAPEKPQEKKTTLLSFHFLSHFQELQVRAISFFLFFHHFMYLSPPPPLAFARRRKIWKKLRDGNPFPIPSSSSFFSALASTKQIPEFRPSQESTSTFRKSCTKLRNPTQPAILNLPPFSFFLVFLWIQLIGGIPIIAPRQPIDLTSLLHTYCNPRNICFLPSYLGFILSHFFIKVNDGLLLSQKLKGTKISTKKGTTGSHVCQKVCSKSQVCWLKHFTYYLFHHALSISLKSLGIFIQDDVLGTKQHATPLTY